MPVEEFTLDSGFEFSVHASEDGDVEKISWNGPSELSQNQVYDLEQFLSDYPEVDTDDN